MDAVNWLRREPFSPYMTCRWCHGVIWWFGRYTYVWFAGMFDHVHARCYAQASASEPGRSSAEAAP